MVSWCSRLRIRSLRIVLDLNTLFPSSSPYILLDKAFQYRWLDKFFFLLNSILKNFILYSTFIDLTKATILGVKTKILKFYQFCKMYKFERIFPPMFKQESNLVKLFWILPWILIFWDLFVYLQQMQLFVWKTKVHNNLWETHLDF